MKIDEQAGAQHAVDFVFTRCVASHQKFELGGLVRAEMVDMHSGSFDPAAHNFVHQPFEGLLFVLGGEAPSFLVDKFVLFIDGDKTEEILPAAFRSERIAFQVDKNIEGGWLGEPTESAAFGYREEFVNGCLLVSRLNLHASLFTDPLYPFSRSMQRLFLQWNREHGELGYGFRAPSFQLVALLAADSSDQGKMIVGAALGVTFAKPAAYVAMLAGFRISIVDVRVVANFLQPRPYVAVIRRIFPKAIGFWNEFFPGGHYIHKFGSESRLISL